MRAIDGNQDGYVLCNPHLGRWCDQDQQLRQPRSSLSPTYASYEMVCSDASRSCAVTGALDMCDREHSELMLRPTHIFACNAGQCCFRMRRGRLQQVGWLNKSSKRMQLEPSMSELHCHVQSA